MELEIYVVRKVNISVKQIEDFLIGSGWNKQPHNEYTNKFQNNKYTNVFAILPIEEGKLMDEKRVVYNALSLIANVNNNSKIDTIVDRILGENTDNDGSDR